MTLIKMSSADYHAHPALGSTSLKRALITPSHYWGYAPENPEHEKMEETEALLFGRIAHVIILEGEEQFRREFCVQPDDIDRRTNVGKDRYANFLLQSAGKTIATQKQADLARAMRKVLEKHFVWKFLQEGVSEGSHFWTENGLDCKVRLDWVKNVDFGPENNGIIIDYKTTKDASPEGFKRQMYGLNYHVQSAHYEKGFESAYGVPPSAFLFIAQEKKFPYAVGAYMVSPMAIQNGHADRKKAMEIILEGRRTGIWHGYTEKIEIIDLPTWAQYQYAEAAAGADDSDDTQETGE